MKRKKAVLIKTRKEKRKKNVAIAAQDIVDAVVSGDFLGCMEEFNGQDRMCMKHCALSLRCAVESQHHIRSEILEDMFYARALPDKLQ